MKRTRFLMIGGFLGAGKTTAIARLARHYMAGGRRVGVITNDQAYDLVDTHSLRAQGFRVGEVPGACFCCKFDDLVATAGQLAADERPDVILTEPVGSCTDLMATVIEPLRHLHGDRYELAPLVVLLKPEHGRKILAASGDGGFSPKAEYIFLKQIEEADVVVIHKVDKLDRAEREQLVDLVRQRFAGKEVLTASAKTGEGFDALVDAVSRSTEHSRPAIEVDYDVYAEGEAELGWLNCRVRVVSAADGDPFPLDRLLVQLVERLRDALSIASAEPAHVKILATADGQTGIANLVGSGVEVELSLASGARVAMAELIVNARVATDPEILATLVKNETTAHCFETGLSADFGEIQRFRPGRPVPTHRMG